MQWGLPKEALKSIWEVVAGDEGRLTQGQFLACIYLMDLAKQGRPLPQRLPPGAFPSVAPAAPAPGAQRALSLSGMQGVRLSRCRRACPASADQLASRSCKALRLCTCPHNCSRWLRVHSALLSLP